MPTPFEGGKNAKELGIDTNRAFVVVDGENHPYLKSGEKVYYVREDFFQRGKPLFKKAGSQNMYQCAWSRLAYADEPKTLYNLEADDVVKDKLGFRMITHVMPGSPLYALSHFWTEVSTEGTVNKAKAKHWVWLTPSQLEEFGFTIVSSQPVEEITIEEAEKRLNLKIKR